MTDTSPCSLCGGPHSFDTSVSNDQWNAVIRANGLPDYLCFVCVVKAFTARGLGFTATLWGDGLSGVSIEVHVNEKKVV